MTEPARGGRRSWWKYLLIITVAGILCLLAGLWYTTTQSFQNLVRRRIVAEVERITGGHAEIGSFHTTPFRMQVEVRDITVHGREPASDVPLAHVDKIVAQVKVISFLGTEFGFHDVILDHPTVHIAFYPDNTTNVPARAQRTSDKSPVEPLFALSINDLEVRHGELLWNDQTFPLDFAAHDGELQMQYSHLHSRYEGRLLLGKVDTKFKDFRPFAWMTAVEFTLSSGSAEIKSLKLDSGRSHVEASGRISDLRRVDVQATYDAHIDLAEAANISRRRDLRGGMAEFKGNGNWSGEGSSSLRQFATSGALALSDFAWQNNQVALNKASASSDYSVTDQQIRLWKLQGKLLGGSFSGEAQIDNWLNSTPASRSNQKKPGPKSTAGEEIAIVTAVKPQKGQTNKRKPPEVQSGSIHLRLRDVSAGELTAALNSPAHPMGHFRPAGFATGSLDARWKGSLEDAEIAFLFDLNPPLRSAPGELPVTARLQGTYRGLNEELELKELTVSAPASRIQASGMLSSSSSLRLSVSTSNLDELRPIIAAMHGPANLPFSVNGSATLNGVVGGKPSAPAFAGTLVAQDFDFTLPARGRAQEQQVHWDSLSTNAQFSTRGMVLRNGSLHRGDTSAEFDVTASLQGGRFTEDSPFNAHVTLHNVDIASTAALAGYDYPLTGKADFVLQWGGTQAHPRVEGRIHAINASAYSESIAQFDADLRIAQGETALNNIHLIHEDSAVTGSAGYNPSTRAFRLDLVGKNFDLGRIPKLQTGRLSVEGRADFAIQGSGTPEVPNLVASLQLRDLTVDHELAGGFNVEAVTKGGALHVTGRSDFARGSLLMDGDVQMHEDYPATLSLRMDHLDLDPLWRAYLRGQLTGHSAVAGTMNMRGPLRDWSRWTLDGSLSDVFLDVEYAKLHNQDPVRFTYAQQTLHLEQMHLVAEGTDLTSHGSIQFGGERELNLTADGHVDLKLFNSFDPDLNASGLMSMNMTMGGTLSEPLPQGSLQLSNGAVTYAGLPSGLSEMNGALAFTQDHIRIEKLSARTGGGTLDLKGDATIYNRQVNFNLTAVGKGVRLRYPPGVSSTADAEIHWVGTQSSSTLSGEIFVTKLAVTPNFDFSSYLERSRQMGAIAPPNSPLYNVKLDLHVQTAPELQMKTAVARLSGGADLHLRGSVAHPSVLGRADILEGEATFNGTKFSLERGDITFANPVAIEPIVNLQASTHVRNYDLNITVTGTPDRLAVNYRSEPPLPKSDIIALLALGRTSEESQQLQQQSGQTLFTEQATTMIINEALSPTPSSRIQKLFGVSRVKIDPQGLTTETNPTARGPQVTIEQQFANNVSLTYSTNVSQSTEQIIQGQYFFTRSISVVGTRDQNGVVSFYLRIRRQKK